MVKISRPKTKIFIVYIVYFLLAFTAIYNLTSCSSDTDDITQSEPSDNEYDNNDTNDGNEDDSNITNKPNILLIIADDMGMDASPYDTSFNTARSLKPNMPTITKLYEDGIRFENTWVYPTCSPTRASIITGKTSTKTGVLSPGDHLNATEITLQNFIKSGTNDTYDTGVFGKWHLSSSTDDIKPMGIDMYRGTNPSKGGVPDYYNWTLHEFDNIADNQSTYTTTAFTQFAIDWIKERQKPWFCWIAYNAAHTASGEFHTPKDANSYTTTGSINLRKYMQMLEAMDYEIGRLLDTLDEQTRNNTTIIFVGDNGTPGKAAQAPFENGKAKGSLHSGGVNTPFIVSGYGVDRKNITETALVQSTDLYATIADLCGVENHDVNQSMSFKSLLSADVGSHRSVNFSASANGYTLRNSNYKLNYDNNTQQESLYYLSTDFDETDNLLDNTLDANTQQAYDVLKNAYNAIK